MGLRDDRGRPARTTKRNYRNGSFGEKVFFFGRGGREKSEHIIGQSAGLARPVRRPVHILGGLLPGRDYVVYSVMGRQKRESSGS